MAFQEKHLELAIIDLFKAQGYAYVNGESIHKAMPDVLLRDDLKAYLKSKYAADKITQTEIDSIILSLDTVSHSALYEANRQIFKKMSDGFIFKREDRSKKDLFIELIDFSDKGTVNNIFKIVNQLEIQGYEKRIPDAIVYINGLPVVVLEFKSAAKENTTIHDAYRQLTVRYKRDIPELFKYNAFVVISDGANNKYGSFFSPYDFFYAWRVADAGDAPVDGIKSLYAMIRGLFRKDRLLEIIKDFIYFPDTSTHDLKIVCRYPQYFAATKLLENIKINMRPEGSGKGGTYFGATGCGKSYTMLFLTRLLMRSTHFSSPTIVLITDRTDLDDQLSELFTNAKQFIGDECVKSVESRSDLLEFLEGRTSGGVFLTTIHKFTEDIRLLSRRENIICISDEAHRSQVNLQAKTKITEKGVEKKYGFAKYLHDSFPNATYVGFTGTPIDATIDVFGKIVDAYTMTESVRDGITVNLVYEGRAAKVLLDQDKVKAIEAYYDKCADDGANEYQIEESKDAIAKIENILGDPDRLRAVAADFVAHYERRVAEGATVSGKAMFVCSKREIAFELYQYIIDIRPEWAVKKEADDGVVLSEKDKRELKAVEKIRMVMTRDKDDDKKLYDLLGTKDYRKELDRQFKNVKSNMKIAIVVDMWITGFDVPCLDTIYIDKPIQQHTLIQTISRVNRVYEGKKKGLIVDYIGIKKNMNLALKKYTDYDCDEFEEVGKSVIIVKDTLDVLRMMFLKFDSRPFFTGTPLEQLECLNQAVEYIQTTEDLEKRFMAAVKHLKDAFNLCVYSEDLSDSERDYIHFYLAVRAVLFKRTTGTAPDSTQMTAQAKKLLNEAIISDGVEELFKSGKDMNKVDLDIFGEEYLAKIAQIKLPNTKIKILQRLLRQAIDEYKKVNKIKGVEFSEKLKALVDKYNNRKDDLAFANEVLDDVADQLAQLLRELQEDRNSFAAMGIGFEEKAFYDILKTVAKKYEFEYPEDKLIALSKKVKEIVDDKAKYTDWSKREDIKSELKVDLILLLAEHGYPPVPQDEVFKEIFEQAENFKKYN